MPRIHCSCGKTLNVGDKLAGKRIKCPACGAVQVVSASPGVETKAKPQTSPLANKSPGKSVPQKSTPPRRKSSDTAPSKPPWLLIGGAAAAGLLLAAGLGWFLFLSGDNKPAATTKKVVVAQTPKPVVADPIDTETIVPPPKVDRIEDDADPLPKPKPPAPANLSVRLKNVKAAWIDGQQAVSLSADYSILGETKPKPDADYILYAKFADSGGMKKSYRVQTMTGTALNAGGKFANSKIDIDLPPKSMTSVCDVTLVEKAPGNPLESVVESQENVFVGGTAPAPAPAVVVVDLSNAKVKRLANKMVRFTVDYKFTSGQADAAKSYTLLANVVGGKAAKPQAKTFDGTGDKLTKQGTFTKDLTFDAPANAKIELWLTEAASSGLKGTMVSNRLTVKMTTVQADPAIKPMFQIQKPLAKKNPALIPSCRPRHFNFNSRGS